MENKTSKLLQAQRYEEQVLRKGFIHAKPFFHFCAPTGWINDPNGFSVYKDEYHLFYQYHPYSTKWGPMHWGHTKSKDFIKWIELPIALAPDQKYDGYGCFSGTAIEDNGKQIIAYTSVFECEDHGKPLIRQTQSIAIGDGVKYIKQSDNPVLGSDMIPEKCSKEDFRDPKIWKEDQKYHMLVANRKEDGRGHILEYSSENLKEWKYEGVLYDSEERIGNMWECPDFFTIQDKKVLLISPQDMMARELKSHSGNGSIYLVADKNKKKFEPENISIIDYGIDFYAPQTLKTLDGRRIMIAWMQSWDVESYPEDFEWHGMMTLPRELTLIDGKLWQNPVAEITRYWKNEVAYYDEKIMGEKQLDGITGRMIDLSVNLKEMACTILKIKLAKCEDTYISIELDQCRDCLTFSRRYSWCIRDIVNERVVDGICRNKEISLRIIMDLYSIEIFINHGEKALTSLFFIEKDFEDIVFETQDGYCILDLIKRDIQL